MLAQYCGELQHERTSRIAAGGFRCLATRGSARSAHVDDAGVESDVIPDASPTSSEIRNPEYSAVAISRR